MADIINVGRSVKDLRTSPKLPAVSAVRMYTDDKSYYEAGTDTGYELEIDSPWATQAQATWLLSKFNGFEYAPFEADTGQLPPQAEIGDYCNIRGVFGGLLTEDITFGKGYAANFGAPYDEEVDHEYKFESRADRALRQKVSRKSPTGNTTFGWSLQDDQWKIYNQNGDIFRVSATGAWLKGHFEITEGSININNKFQVDADGNLYATSGTFTGEVYAGNITYSNTDDNIGTFSGSGLTASTVGYGKTTTSVQSNLDQVWTNQSDIAAINAMFVGVLSCNSLEVSHNVQIGSLHLSYDTFSNLSPSTIVWTAYR